MKKKGFTLVELLVVIAIIAMLLAILMPALSRVRALAMRLMCGTNLNGLGKACLVYANENQDSYPIIGSSTCFWPAAVLVIIDNSKKAGTKPSAFIKLVILSVSAGHIRNKHCYAKSLRIPGRWGIPRIAYKCQPCIGQSDRFGALPPFSVLYAEIATPH